MEKIICIDGTAASGKSTISAKLAQALDWQWVSTGAFYRAIAYLVLSKHQETDLDDEDFLVQLIQKKEWEIRLSELYTLIFVDGKDVSQVAYGETYGSAASRLSRHPEVRKLIVLEQRKAHSGQGLVAEGRDCGDVIFPQAPLKFFVNASAEVRAKRRAAQLGVDYEQISEEQKKRDYQDTHRASAPLKSSKESVLIETDQFSLDEIISLMVKEAQNRFDFTPE